MPTSYASNESWRERVMSAARSAVERAGLYGHAAVNALVLDDWKALTDAHSSTLQRIEGGASLASWAIPEGKVAEIAGHAIAKAGELAARTLRNNPPSIRSPPVSNMRRSTRKRRPSPEENGPSVHRIKSSPNSIR